MTTNELTSPEAVEKLAAQYDDVGLRDDELVTATLRALSAEIARLTALDTPALPTPAEPDADEREALVVAIGQASDPALTYEAGERLADALLAAGWTRKREEG